MTISEIEGKWEYIRNTHLINTRPQKEWDNEILFIKVHLEDNKEKVCLCFDQDLVYWRFPSLGSNKEEAKNKIIDIIKTKDNLIIQKALENEEVKSELKAGKNGQFVVPREFL